MNKNGVEGAWVGGGHRGGVEGSGEESKCEYVR